MRSLILAAAAVLSLSASAQAETAVFAGGCFWCVETDFDKIKGVTETISGYAGGSKSNPTYEDHEGYTEAVRITFDENTISFDEMVNRFLRTIDVTDGDGQFCDQGPSYVPAIFVMSDAQRLAAEKAVATAEKTLGQKLAVPVLPFTSFGPAEDYHQNYHQGENRVFTRFGWIRQSDAYARYRKACGRDARVKEVWGDEAYTAGKSNGAS